jgi:hypothetical protein
VPLGSLSKAAFVGAKTVNGPAFDKTSINSAAFKAVTSVVWSGEPAAIFTMSFSDTSSFTFD